MGFFVLLVFLITSVWVILKNPQQLFQLSRLEAYWFFGLCVATAVTTTIFATVLPIRFADGFLLFSLFSAVPIILSAAILPRVPTFIIGLITGAIITVTVTHGIYDVFHFGLAALAISWLFTQPYAGRFYELLRNPIVAGMIGMGVTAVLTSITLFFTEMDSGRLLALDTATFVLGQTIILRLFEGFFGGVIVWIIQMWLPEIQPKREKILPPFEKSLRNRLLWDLIIFSSVLSVVVLTLVYNLSVYVSRKLVLNQMANIAQLISEDIPPFYNNLQDVTAALNGSSILVDGSPEEQNEEMADIYKSGGIFSKLMLVDKEQSMRLYYPENEANLNLSNSEQAAVNLLFASNQTTPQSVTNEQGDLLSFIVPITNESGETAVALIGRVQQIEVNSLIAGVYGNAGNSNAFIVDENNTIIAHVDQTMLDTSWSEENGRLLTVATTGQENGARQLALWQESQRELVYYLKETSHPWTVVVTTPYSVALNLAIGTGGPLFIVLLALSLAYYYYLRTQTSQISDPLLEIANASTAVANNQNWVPPTTLTQRQDEIGQLSKSFELMQKSVKQRISDLSLLLAVSEEVSLSLDIEKGMPALLRGMLRGTSASGARAMVINPAGGNPLIFGEGPLAPAMAVLDRILMTRLRAESELVLASPRHIAEDLGLDDTFEIPVQSLTAIPLHARDRFQGVLWLGYQTTQSFDPSERKLINTLSNQAALLAGNAHLFASAESGRRRLYAVIASTREPVIVTDPTDIILIINPAFADLFGLKISEARNHRVQAVIKSKPLQLALTAKGEHHRNVEIEMEDGRIFYANSSTIMGQHGQTFGRVSVLHDITHLKEIDELKSDFVQTVSHDLKNPLTFMSGYVAMLPMAGDLNEKQTYYIEKINNGIEQMTQLVADLLDLGRIEAGVDFNRVMISVPTLLTSITDEYWQHAHMAGVKLKLELDPNLPQIRGDMALLKQAITNLVANGIKYAPKSGDLFLRAKESNGDVVISVKDNGPGIPEKDQIRLFEKFYRVKQPGTESIKGSGLGLAIVKSVAERHGGRAGCYSKKGQGATFYISLPSQKKTVTPPPELEHM